MPSTLFAFDTLGIQPVSPYGVFSVFSAETLQKNMLAAEISFERTKHPEFYRFGLKGAYGINDSVEVDFMAPFIYRYLNASDGMEDFSIGIRHRFYDEGKFGPSLAYMITASFNNGGNEFSTDGGIGAGLIASKRIGPFKGHVNVFFHRPGTGRLKDEVVFAGAVDFAATNSMNVLGEAVIRKDHSTQRYNDIETRIGYRLKTLDFMYTTLGVGFDLRDNTPQYRLMLSVSLTSPQKAKEIRRVFEEE